MYYFVDDTVLLVNYVGTIHELCDPYAIKSLKSYPPPTKLFSLDSLLISIAFSMFNQTAQLAPLTS